MNNQTKERTLYRHIIRGAWEVTWHHKRLWVLAFFAAFLGTGGAVDTIYRAASDVRTGAPYADGLTLGHNLSVILRTGSGPERLSVIFAIIILLAVCGLIVFLVVSSCAGAMLGTARVVKKQSYTIRALLREGASHFWPIFGVRLVRGLITGSLLLFTAAAFYAAAPGGRIGTPLFVILFITTAIANIIVSFLATMATVGISVRGTDTLGAIEDAWRLFTRHWLVSVEMIAALLVASLAAGIALIVGAAILSIPIVMLLVAAGLLGGGGAITAVFILAGLLILALIITVGCLLSSFQVSAWTLLYLRLAERTSPHAKLERLFRKLAQRFAH